MKEERAEVGEVPDWTGEPFAMEDADEEDAVEEADEEGEIMRGAVAEKGEFAIECMEVVEKGV